MGVYHVVLFKLKPDIIASSIAEMEAAANNMVGKVPGLESIKFGPPHVSTADRSKGYDLGLVAVLDKPETLKIYAEHPEHLKLVKFRKELCSDALAYDLEF